MDLQARLDPDLLEALEALPGGFDPGTALGDMNVVRVLRSTSDLLSVLGGSVPSDDRVEVVDSSISESEPAVALRVYSPRDHRAEPLPAVVFFHGGAFVLGDLYSEELRCLRYCAQVPCVVVSVGYRLAPEDPYPAAVEDCYAGLEWTVANAGTLGVDTGRIAVAGSSAGGALAAATALMARDRGGPALAAQLLVYPVTDDRMQTPSMKAFDSTPLWTSGSSAQMWDYYLGTLRGGDVPPYAAPARAEDLSLLPPAYVCVAELDPLRDEGLDYARRLIEAGVPTELHAYARTCHGFDILCATSPLGGAAIAEQARALHDIMVGSESRSGRHSRPVRHSTSAGEHA